MSTRIQAVFEQTLSRLGRVAAVIQSRRSHPQDRPATDSPPAAKPRAGIAARLVPARQAMASKGGGRASIDHCLGIGPESRSTCASTLAPSFRTRGHHERSRISFVRIRIEFVLNVESIRSPDSPANLPQSLTSAARCSGGSPSLGGGYSFSGGLMKYDIAGW